MTGRQKAQRSNGTTLGIGLAAIVLVASGCSGTQDPAQAGFLDGVANLAGGTYDARIEQREQARAAAEVEASRLEARAAELETERRALAAEEAAARDRLQRLNVGIAQQQAQLRDLETRQGVDQQRLAQLRTWVQDLETRRDSLLSEDPDPTLQREVDQLEREVALLRQDIDAIIAGLAAQE